MADIRTFIAIELPGMVKQHLSGVIQKLGALEDRVRFINPENAHVTLKFLGDMDIGRVTEVVQAMRRVGAGVGPMTLCTTGVGGFPNAEQARVIWAGLGGDVGPLGQLHGAVEQALAPLGFGVEKRKYFPHITLGRVRRNPVGVDLAQVGDLQHVHFRADHLVVMQSDLQAEGAVYSPLGIVLLGAQK